MRIPAPVRHPPRSAANDDDPDAAVAARAVAIVSQDPAFVRVAHDPVFQPLGEWAGAARNLWSIARGVDPSTIDAASRACTGIAKRAAELLEAARRRGELPGVRLVRTVERRAQPDRDDLLTPYHTAVALTLDAGRTLVLDWHASLDLDRPKRATLRSF